MKETIEKLFEGQDSLLESLICLLESDSKTVLDFSTADEISEYIDNMDEWVIDAIVVEDVLSILKN